jgi:hypothetical protein
MIFLEIDIKHKKHMERLRKKKAPQKPPNQDTIKSETIKNLNETKLKIPRSINQTCVDIDPKSCQIKLNQGTGVRKLPDKQVLKQNQTRDRLAIKEKLETFSSDDSSCEEFCNEISLSDASASSTLKEQDQEKILKLFSDDHYHHHPYDHHYYDQQQQSVLKVYQTEDSQSETSCFVYQTENSQSETSQSDTSFFKEMVPKKCPQNRKKKSRRSAKKSQKSQTDRQYRFWWQTVKKKTFFKLVNDQQTDTLKRLFKDRSYFWSIWGVYGCAHFLGIN